VATTSVGHRGSGILALFPTPRGLFFLKSFQFDPVERLGPSALVLVGARWRIRVWSNNGDALGYT